ncbi:MAG TPA: sensor histidine kinase [Actinomycetes bacterium]|nr:sensor histidine kinase [Actinomycetes bacterium]
MRTPRLRGGVRTAAPALTDAGVGVGVAVGLLAASWAGAGPRWIGSPRPLDAVAVGLVGVVAGALALRRRYPIWVLVVLNAVALAWAAGHYPGRLLLLAPLLGCYTLAAARGWRWGLAGALGTALGALLAIRVGFGAAAPAGAAGIAVWMAATAGAAGTAVGYYRALLVATRAQLARQAQTHQAQARRRAVEERLRIARELHDVFGHTMATISVQAGVGIHLLQQRPGQAVEALTTIKQISDQALADVKTILGVLRADSDPDEPRTPPGGLGQLAALLEPVRSAGVAPRLSVHGHARPLPAAVDLAAYRIIQEALTNVLRHAGARTVWLEVRYQPQRVVIGIRDDGTAANPAGSNGADGHGIPGMRERALALGGHLTAGPHPDGGFQVRCALPTPKQTG